MTINGIKTAYSIVCEIEEMEENIEKLSKCREITISTFTSDRVSGVYFPDTLQPEIIQLLVNYLNGELDILKNDLAKACKD